MGLIFICLLYVILLFWLSGPVCHLAVFCTRSSTFFRAFCKRVNKNSKILNAGSCLN